MKKTDDDINLALFIDFENLAIGARQSRYEKSRSIFAQATAGERPHPVQAGLLRLDQLPQREKLFTRRPSSSSTSPSAHDRQEFGRHPHGGGHTRSLLHPAASRYVRDRLGRQRLSPLVSKLREYDKLVVGVGVKNSSSALLIDNCDEFIFYEDLIRGRREKRTRRQPAEKEARGLRAARRRCAGPFAAVPGDHVELDGQADDAAPQPDFNMQYFGYSNFSDLLEDAEKGGRRHHRARRAQRFLHRARRRRGSGLDPDEVRQRIIWVRSTVPAGRACAGSRLPRARSA